MSASDAHTILVVDDDDALAEMIGLVLAQEGFNAVFCENGARAFETFMRCQKIRRSSNVPIIMLTAKSDTEDVVKGLEAGADDYIAKPFKHAELLARIRTRLRPRESRQLVVSIGDIVMDMDGRTVKYHSTEVPMTPLEFDLLAALVRHPGQALSRQELLDMVWGYTDVSDSLVNVHVQRLRAKFDELGADRFIQTVRGVGYKIPTELVGSSGS